MVNQINPNLPKDKELAKQVIESQNEIDKIKLERGWLGGIWGNTYSIQNNIAALSVILLIFTGIIYSFCTINTPPDKLSIPIKDFWAIISPLITLAIGFLFGDKMKKNAP
jgi:hypothetical protein